jgi:hypothetical protein
MPSLASRLTRIALRRGIAEGSRGWLYVGVATVAVRAAHRLLTEPETVFSTELRPGQALQIRNVRPPR